jgi:hypothetical protein
MASLTSILIGFVASEAMSYSRMLFTHHSLAPRSSMGDKISPLKMDDTMTETAKAQYRQLYRPLAHSGILIVPR